MNANLLHIFDFDGLFSVGRGDDVANWVLEKEDEINKLIKETIKSILFFSKTGYKNEELIQFVRVYDKFDDFYKRELKFSMDNFLKNTIGYDGKQTLQIQLDSQQNDMKKYTFGLDESEHISQKLEEEINKKIFRIAYLSNLNILYELYNEENEQRELYLEFNSQGKDSILNLIVNTISSDCIAGSDLIQRLKNKVKEKEIMERLEDKGDYFRLVPLENDFNVFLTEKGNSYYQYLKYKDKKYSGEELDTALYQNVEHLLKAIEIGIKEGTDKSEAYFTEHFGVVEYYNSDTRKIIKRKIMRTCNRIKKQQKNYQISIPEYNDLIVENGFNGKSYKITTGGEENEREYFEIR